jgi:hypothetical protein
MIRSLAVIYLSLLPLVFCSLLVAFLQDASTRRTDIVSWAVVIIAALLWPIVLPTIGYHYYQKIGLPQKSHSEQAIATEN